MPDSRHRDTRPLLTPLSPRTTLPRSRSATTLPPRLPSTALPPRSPSATLPPRFESARSASVGSAVGPGARRLRRGFGSGSGGGVARTCGGGALSRPRTATQAGHCRRDRAPRSPRSADSPRGCAARASAPAVLLRTCAAVLALRLPPRVSLSVRRRRCPAAGSATAAASPDGRRRCRRANADAGLRCPPD